MNNLKIIETGLIKVYETDKGEKVVDARELHEGLQGKQQFTDWIKGRLIEVDAVENVDFIVFHKLMKNEYGLNVGRPKTEYILKLDTAKEVAMLERNEKGKQYRRYFIEVEKKYKEIQKPQLPQDYKQALQHLLIAVEEKEKLQLTIEQQKPKVIFADAVSATNDTILIRDLAKILKQNGIQIGGNVLFDWLRNKGYLIKQKGTDYNRPTQKSMDLELFKVKETAITHSDGKVTTSITTKVTGKGQQYFINKFLKQQQVKCI
jgi:anti-repressor protein